MTATPAPLLEVAHLSIRLGRLPQNIVDDVSFTLNAGETLCLVGESGCGKSLTALALMGLLQSPPLAIAGGTARFEGEDLLTMPPARLRETRGGRMAMIFQEPMTSLNPAIKIGEQIAESVRRHKRVSPAAARSALWKCCAGCASRPRKNGLMSFRISSLAVCASGR
ncbi:ATP-binding cassette domain-containing protein [Fontisubflavum oceani]|uniref:ATP-binding cassette domain-containing protein n=1 Tax=Fontisubflavum oceani TaxID=2978973 RepID=UPI002ED357A7